MKQKKQKEVKKDLDHQISKMINLEEHKVYVESRRMEMIPYSVAVQALTEVLANYAELTEEFEKVMEEWKDSVYKTSGLDD